MPADTPWYEVLGVSPFASDERIREAYLALVREWHPDQFLDAPERYERALEQIKLINAAYDDVRNGPPVSAVWAANSAYGATVHTVVDPTVQRSLIFPRTGIFVRVVALVLAVMYLLVALMHAVTR